jgi:hypothetical protein
VVKRPALAVGIVAAILAVASSALAARSFSDSAGDVNTAPDVTGIEISEAAGVVTLRLTVGNFQTLPENSWVNLWLDTDSNQDTGAEGDETLVRYLSTGEVELYRWNGSQLVEAASAGLTSAFAGGVLTVTAPRASVAAATPFGLLAVASRGQPVGDEELVASDFIPDQGRLAFAGAAPAAASDPAGDHDAAPDITAVRVTDARSGWITFDIATPNYAVLPEASAVVVTVDADASARTGEEGADIQLALAAGQLAMERWDGAQWVPDDLPTRARFRNAGNRVAIDLHVSELGSSPRIRFSLLSADVNTAIQGVVAIDIAPEGFTYWSYTLANKPALTLVGKRLSMTPSALRAGRPGTVRLAVTRSDTGRSITSGSVSCRVSVGTQRIAARGSVGGGAGRCTFGVPANAKGKTLRGEITVRSGGARVARDFAFVVR